MKYSVRGKTVDATPVELTGDGQPPRTPFPLNLDTMTPGLGRSDHVQNRIDLRDNTACSFKIEINSRDDADVVETHRYEGTISRGVGVASTVLVGTPTPNHDPSAPTRAISVSADVTNGCLKLEVAGTIPTTWMGTVELRRPV